MKSKDISCEVPIEHIIKLTADTAAWWRKRMIDDPKICAPELVVLLAKPPHTVSLGDACCSFHAEETIQEANAVHGAKYLIRMSGVTREHSVMSIDGKLLPLEACHGMMVSLRTGADPTPLWATFCEITEDGPQELEHVTDGEWAWETMP